MMDFDILSEDVLIEDCGIKVSCAQHGGEKAYLNFKEQQQAIVLPGHTLASKEQQDWLNKRFEGLLPDHFGCMKNERVCFCSPAHLTAPPEFEDVWIHYQDIGESGGGRMGLPEALREARHLVIFLDGRDPAQACGVYRLLRCIVQLGMEMPLSYAAPHSTEAEAEAVAIVDTALALTLMKRGLDGVLVGQPVGFSLALALRMHFQQSATLCECFNNKLHERSVNVWRATNTQRSMHYIMWEYPRVRNSFMIPMMNSALGRGEPTHIDGFVVEQRPVTGECLKLYNLRREEREETVGEGVRGAAAEGEDGLLLLMDKSQFRGLRDLRVARMYRLLGSEQWSHPNLLRLLAVHHSPTHLMFRFNGSASETLYRRLVARDVRPLPSSLALPIIKQATDVVSFLHNGPSVAHLNLKPENFICCETNGTITLKLLGFDYAAAQADGNLCRRCNGSVPFVAPELCESRPYCGLTADVWSLGIVFLEIACGLHTVERLLGWKKEYVHQADWPRTFVARLRESLEPRGAVARLVEQQCLQEMRPALPVLRSLLECMLRTKVEDRCTTKRVMSTLTMYTEQIGIINQWREGDYFDYSSV